MAKRRDRSIPIKKKDKMKLKILTLIITCTFFTSTAQILLKLGSENLSFDIVTLITNTPLLLGLVFYAVAAILLILSLREEELSIVYPIISTSYVWVAILSSYLFNEVLTTQKMLGLGIIIGGVSLLGINK